MSDQENYLQTALREPDIKSAMTPIGKELGIEGPFMVRDGFGVVDIEKHLPIPRTIVANMAFGEINSMATYVGHHATDHLLVEFSLKAQKVVAILDYHGPDQPSRCSHLAWMSFPWSEQVKGLLDREKMSDQEDFADFIYEFSPYITTPDSAAMLDLANNIHLKSTSEVKGVINTANGGRSIQFSEDVQSTVQLPKEIIWKMPAFTNAPVFFNITSRINIRATGGKISIGLKFLQKEMAKMSAINALVSGIKEHFPDLLITE